ncbi:hypothetical protein [Bradyrhizobium sp. LHD-71]|uniref:hypothetical protein n=1 Tax=Bradyrhizobium sp. LHD-71 TaxID=3072141 RepID=UPI00280EC461|nr:hypothetical protein [Bradyrhizobium sp. LHD-71]MDQ8726407.1 hypothetical protein [Bradyrhizobium sp. LHD-71]
MRAAGLALVCVVIGGGMTFGYVAAGRDYLASLRVLDFLDREQRDSEAYPEANREGKHDRMVSLRSGGADDMPQSNVQRRGDSLRQSYAAVDPVDPVDSVTPQSPQSQPAFAEPPPLPKPRPKALLLRRQQAVYTLLSDLQIDAIKARLKLTPAQERNWPAVEVALRDLAGRLQAMKKSGEASTDLPPDSAEFAKLKAAATPFVAQLTADQKRELKMLAHLIGLGKVVAQL